MAQSACTSQTHRHVQSMTARLGLGYSSSGGCAIQGGTSMPVGTGVCVWEGGGGGIPCLGKYESPNSGTPKFVQFLKNEQPNYV